MNKTLKASDEVKKLHRMFAALGEVVEVLDRVGSVEQAEQEASARVEKLKVEADKLATKINAASIEAQEIVAAAKVKADEAIGEAITAAHSMQSQALAELQAAKSDADLMVSTAREMLQKAEADAAAAEARRRVADDELAETEKKIDAARSRIAKLLGA